MYRALACTAMLAAELTLMQPCLAASEEADAESSVTTVEGELSLPDMTSEPENVVPVEEATPEQLVRIKPLPTPEEIRAAEEKAAKERAEAEARAERERIEAEKKAAEEAAREKAREEARADASAADAQIRGDEPAVTPAAVPEGQEEGEAEAAEAAAVSEKPAEKPETAAPSTKDSMAAADRWAKVRPEEQRIAAWVDSLEGKTIVDVVIEGAGEKTEQLAKEALQTRPGDSFTKSRIEADRIAIYDVGFFYDLFPTFQIVPEGVVVTYHVLENPVLKTLSVEGNTVVKSEEIAKLLTVPTGEMLNTKTLKENIQAISDRYKQDGYILVKISDLGIDRNGALKIKINEGVLEGYVVKGNTKTKERVVVREMRIKPGEPFNAKKARRSIQRVYNLGFFEDVNIKLNPGKEPNAVVVEVDVVEKRTGTFTVGAGYSSQDGFIGMVGVGDTNFRGIGDAINFTFEFSGNDTDAHGYMFSYRRPWLDRRETSATFRIYNRTYEYNDYNTNGDRIEEYMRKYSGGEIMFGRPMSEYSTNYFTFRNRKERYIKHTGSSLDRSTPEYKPWRDYNFGTTRSLIFSHVTDTRDNVFFPMTGSKVNLTGEIAGMGGDFKYQKFTFEDNHFFKVGRSQVFAVRAMYGRGFGHIPESGQFRIGGQNTLRGYRDEQFRGNNTFLGTLEYRFPIFKKVQGALFTDFGAAWNNGWMPKGMHESIGFGMSVQTPVGPIRVDLAHGSQGNRVHFSVGGTF